MVLANVDFWDVFWLLLIWIPLLLLWAFALIDIFGRDDLSGGTKALWVLAVILLPLVGTLVYLLFRPSSTTPEEQRALAAAQEAYDASIMADRLTKLSELHDKGKLTDAEWAQAKTRILAAAGPAPAATPAPSPSPWAPPVAGADEAAVGDIAVSVDDAPSGSGDTAGGTPGGAGTAS